MRAIVQLLATALLIAMLPGCDDSGGQADRRSLPEPPRQESAGSAKPEVKSSQATEAEREKASDPTHSLPLEYHLDSPPVPERIQGPSPPIPDQPA
ncbi:MAG: hypothetical protein HUU20_27775 [Pirellulales bacterium]|nr:hypothetical protein [Pirellulales bacterium]